MIESLRRKTLDFIRGNRVLQAGYGAYRYSSETSKPTLYASTYAAMTRSLYNDLDDLDPEERQGWIAYLLSHQDDDGLFRDPVIYNQGWYEGDLLWCGRPHLSCHVLVALTCLGAVPTKKFSFLDPYRNPDAMIDWLERADWGDRVSYTGNEIMNIGTLLQYERDFMQVDQSGMAVKAILNWLSSNHIDPNSGMWGNLDLSDPFQRSNAVQAAYHWWPLFFYDRIPIPYMERAIDTLLATQNPLGGFGWGVHNQEEPFKSSACEDIDSIDPLARLLKLTSYRSDEIRETLGKAVDWVMQNQMEDGGFVFLLDRPFEYGHPQLYGAKDCGAMFPAWFRTLSLATIGQALPDHPLGRYSWNFNLCPGFQFN